MTQSWELVNLDIPLIADPCLHFCEGVFFNVVVDIGLDHAIHLVRKVCDQMQLDIKFLFCILFPHSDFLKMPNDHIEMEEPFVWVLPLVKEEAVCEVLL